METSKLTIEDAIFSLNCLTVTWKKVNCNSQVHNKVRNSLWQFHITFVWNISCICCKILTAVGNIVMHFICQMFQKILP